MVRVSFRVSCYDARMRMAQESSVMVVMPSKANFERPPPHSLPLPAATTDTHSTEDLQAPGWALFFACMLSVSFSLSLSDQVCNRVASYFDTYVDTCDTNNGGNFVFLICFWGGCFLCRKFWIKEETKVDT